MIYITGDCHGEFFRFSTKSFPVQKEMTRADFVIVCGDFGLWHDTKQERYWLDWLADKPFTLLFVDGNHENFDRLNSGEFETVDFHGGKAHKIRENIFHLMRGHVFQLCGKRFWCFGGASSHDIQDGILRLEDYLDREDMMEDYRRRNRLGQMIRVEHESWWREELPTQNEMDLGLHTLQSCGNKVDYIITHCAPQIVATLISGGAYKPDILTEYFNAVSARAAFDRWFFGHYHGNFRTSDGKYTLLYERMERVV